MIIQDVTLRFKFYIQDVTLRPYLGGLKLMSMPYTLLSLPRFARIMGLNPLHFARGTTPGLNPVVFPVDGCDDVWYKYDWQDHDKVSRYQLANLILEAEEAIANVVGYWPAPKYISDEYRMYQKPYDHRLYGLGTDVRGAMKGTELRYGRLVKTGKRATSLIGTATTVAGSLAYYDADSDGFYETAVIILPTSITDPKEIKVYFNGQNANPDWEARDPRSITITGGNVTIVFDSWILIDPNLYEDYPTSNGLEPIDVSTVTNFVTSIDVYREYIDTSISAAQFLWEQGCMICGIATCAECEHTTQDGCLHVRNYELGIVVPTPASYNSDTDNWETTAWTGGIEPDITRVWYYAGEIDQRYVNGYSLDPLSNFWAQAISWIVAARLDRPLCGCSNVASYIESLQSDMIANTRDVSYFVSDDINRSPFGTRRGEVMAWRKVKYLVRDKKPKYAIV